MVNWAYVAGFWDGEGWVSFKMRGNCVDHNIGCCQSQPQADCLLRIQEFLAVEGIESKIFTHKYNGPRRHPLCKLYIQGNRENKFRFLDGILPYSIVKRPKILAFMELMKSRPIRNTSFYPELRDARCAEAWAKYQGGLRLSLAYKSSHVAYETFMQWIEKQGYKTFTRSEAAFRRKRAA